jgi:hypothetical protein
MVVILGIVGIIFYTQVHKTGETVKSLTEYSVPLGQKAMTVMQSIVLLQSELEFHPV